MVRNHGDSQEIMEDGLKLQRWMPRGDLLEYQEKIELEMWIRGNNYKRN